VSPTTVTDVVTTTDKISFTVKDTGRPVLVKTSYFPNWEATGAQGPFRVAPNLMVVIPTRHDVTLHYGRTGVDWLGIFLTLTGIGLAVAMWRARRLPIPPREASAAEDPPPAPPPPFGPEEVLATVGGGPDGEHWGAPPEGPAEPT
jgi:hypothetical protein